MAVFDLASEASLLNARRWYRASLNPRMTAPFESGQAPGGAARTGGDLRKVCHPLSGKSVRLRAHATRQIRTPRRHTDRAL